MTNLESAEQKIVKAAEDVVNAVALSSAMNTAESKLHIQIGGLLVELTLRAKQLEAWAFAEWAGRDAHRPQHHPGTEGRVTCCWSC